MDRSVDSSAAEADDEYEDVYVVLELAGVQPQYLLACETYSLIGLDTPTPMLQLGNAIFRGSHEDTIGTSLIFSKDPELAATPGSLPLTVSASQLAGSTQESTGAEYRLACESKQKICFQRVLLEPRAATRINATCTASHKTTPVESPDSM
jgi:hypothetical protein